jgi:ubiquinone/menaquinone biosynthesis C-methylase UbiE
MNTDTTGARRRELREVAEQIAPSWERRRPEIEAAAAPVRRWLVAALDVPPDATLLELAAGMGDTGFEAARRLGPGGHLITSDLSEGMLAGARRRAAALGLERVDLRRVDAEHIDLPDGAVDAVVCRYGYMLVPDPAAALAETRRVLRPGGTLALAVWGPPDRNPFFTVVVTALVELGLLPPPDPADPGVFALADEAHLRAQLAAAGFTDVRTEPVPVTFAVADAHGYVQLVADTAGPIGIAIQRLDGPTRAVLDDRCADRIAPFAAGSGPELPGLALCARATAT